MQQVKLHWFHVKYASDGAMETIGIDADTFDEARRHLPEGVEVLHALDSDFTLRVNGLGERGLEIAQRMREKHGAAVQ